MNTDGIGEIGKSLPSGGFMEKIAEALGTLFGLTSEIANSSNVDNSSNETASETKNDTTFIDYKVTNNEIGGFNHSYKRVVGGKDTTEVRYSTNKNEIQRAVKSNNESKEDNEKR
ncbi:hypothetical protein ACFPIK_16190 [Algoriphagus aquatilis]|uniref:Uncharacterized protein n=1 Tax=Algoriphagus aquatilis TaxID=490186 RepID=A0ABW0BZB5_9BACT